MRLIDADALLADLGINDLECTKCDWCGRFDCVRGSDFRDACNAIEDAPTVDAVAVVRCKDCRWYDNRYGDVCHNPRYGDGWANYPPPYVDEEHFCKDGERKGGDTE